MESIDELETWAIQDLKKLLHRIELEDVIVAMHGLSPDLQKMLFRAMNVSQKVRSMISRNRWVSHRLETVELKHKEILREARKLKG